MDAPRHNSPSRKSRFRAQGSSPYRPGPSTNEPAPETGEDPEAYAPGELPADPATGEADPAATEGNEPGTLPADPAAADEDQLPAGLRLTRAADRSAERVRRPSAGLLVLTALLCLGAGGVGGYLLRGKGGAALAGRVPEAASRAAGPVLPLNPAVLAEIDAAFEASKQGKFTDARQNFARLADQHGEWPSMQIEAARAALYEHNFEAAEKTLSGLLRTAPNVDAEFLMGLLQMTLTAFDKSEPAFGRAVAVDPARPDVFYFWGECLRRQGKPQDAAEKFHQALIRNQYETTEGLYLLKLWLSEIQADQDAAKGSNAKIDADLASGHPSGAALFAAAARHLRAGQFKEAGDRIGQAQKVMDPAVFRVILQDPLFLQENYRAELAPFYK